MNQDTSAVRDFFVDSPHRLPINHIGSERRTKPIANFYRLGHALIGIESFNRLAALDLLRKRR